MSQKSNVFIDIITTFQGANNIKAASSAFDRLASSVKQFVSVYTIEEIFRKSLDAFKNEQASIAKLSNSLSNLGVKYTDIQPVFDKQIQSFIDLGFKSSATIEAYDKLTVALGNPAKALDVLATTADLARYNQEDLVTTAEKVAKAVAGQSRAFASLGLKIDKTLTPQNAFNKLLDEAQKKVGGAANAYKNTLAGALDVTSAKMEYASITLGEKLAPSIEKLSKFAITYLAPIFSLLANNLEPILAIAAAMGTLALAIKGVGIATALASGEMALNPLFAAAALVGLVAYKLAQPSAHTSTGKFAGARSTQFSSKNTVPSYSPEAGVMGQVSATKKLTDAEKLMAQWRAMWAKQSADAAKLKAKADAAAIATAKEKAALDKANSILTLAGSVFDIAQIEIQAALQQKIDDDTRQRLLLQQAILQGNAADAAKLSQALVQTQIEALLVQKANPFETWTKSAQDTLDNLTKIQAQMLAISGIAAPPISGAAQSAITLGKDAADIITQMPDWAAQDAAVAAEIAKGQAAQDVLDAQLAALAAALAAMQSATPQYATTPAMGGFGGISTYIPEVRVLIDPMAAAAGVTAVTQGASASGTSVSTTRINPYG